MNTAYFADTQSSIVIAVPKLPVPSAMRTGSQGLLDIAVNSAMSDDLSKHLATLELKDFQRSAVKLQQYLTDKGFADVRVVNDVDLSKLPEFNAPDGGSQSFAKRDFRTLANEFNTKRLIILAAGPVGTTRAYYGFVPLGAPSVTFWAHADLIDLSNNTLQWHKAFVNTRAVDGDWDQAPDFPNLTNAFYQSLETVTQQVELDFTSSMNKGAGAIPAPMPTH